MMLSYVFFVVCCLASVCIYRSVNGFIDEMNSRPCDCYICCDFDREVCDE